MIKKSRKILTLLLTVLLIMSSMSALTVSADDTSYVITDGTTVINSSNTTKSYTFTHSLETGYYTLKVGTTVPTVDNKMLTIKATIGSDSWSGDHRFTSTSRTITTGTFYLTQGASYTVDLTCTLGPSQDVTITELTFSKFTNIIELSTTAETKVSVLDYFNRKFRTGNTDRESSNYSWNTASDDTTVKSKAVLTANCFVINRVSVPQDTWYDVYSLAGTTSSYNPKLTLSVDGTDVVSSVAATVTGALTKNAYTHLGAIKLAAGTHDLKLLTSGTMYLAGMKLVPCSLNDEIVVSSSHSPEFSFYNDKLSGSFTDGDASYGPPSIAEGQNFTLDGTDGYVSAASGDYATYLVNVTEAGMYDINFIGGQRQVTLNVLIDGVQPVKSLSSTYLKGYGTTASVNSNVVKATAATAYLTEGVHEIKFEFTNSTANWFYKWMVEPTAAVTDLSTTAANEILAKSTPYYNYTDASSEINATSPTLSGVYAGNEANGYVITRSSKTYYYVVNSPVAQEYALSTITCYTNGNANVTITDVDTDEELYSGKIADPSESNYSSVKTDLGKISLKAGRTILKVQPRNNAQFLHAFILSPVVENKIIADIDAEIDQGTGYQEVTVPIKFEGNLTLGAIQVNVAYDEGVEYVSSAAGSCYEGGTSTISKAGTESPVKVSWIDMDAIGVDFTTGTYATLTFNVPKSVAKDYNFTVSVIKCEELTGVEEFTNIADTIETVNGKVTVKSTAPIITFTDGSDVEQADVVEGTMKLNVDLNGNAKDLVIFAIYSDDGEFAVLEYSQTATIENGIATATINTIELDDSKNYYAKAFVWDTTTYYGFTQTIGE